MTRLSRLPMKKVLTSEISNRYIEDYFASMDALNVIRADAYPRD